MVRKTVIPSLCRTSHIRLFQAAISSKPPSASSYDMTYASTATDMETSALLALSTTHAIFLIPELLINILLQLPDTDLKTCYCVSPLWGEVLRAHLPPEKLPLPEPIPSYRPLNNKLDPDLDRLRGVILHPYIKLFDVDWLYELGITVHPDRTET
jgi:hypothetical protein